MTSGHSLGEVAFHLLCHGAALDAQDAWIEGAVQRWGPGERLLELELNPHWHLQVAVATGRAEAVKMRVREESVAIDYAGETFPARIECRPEFLDQTAPSGVPRSALARTFYNYLMFHPLSLHAEGAERRVMITPPGAEPIPLEFDDVLDVTGAALRAERIDGVSLRWALRVTPGEVDVALGPLLRAIRRNFDVVIAAECPPPRDAGALDLLYGEGADAISLPILGMTADAPRGATLAEALHALQRAVVVFPRGTVLAPLLLGCESPAATRETVSRLASMGACAALDTRLLGEHWEEHRRVWTSAEIAHLWQHLEEEIARARLARPWTPHPMTESLAIPAWSFDPAAPCEPLRGGFWQSRPGQMVVKNLIRLRRRLRVRRVDQSLESSEL